MNRKTAVIFGVGGQDGYYLTELLLEKEYFVVGVVRRTSLDNTTRLNKFKDNINFNIIEGDITDSVSVTNIINHYQPDEVYNLAAQSHVQTSFEQPAYTFQVNAMGPLYILEAIKNSSKQIKMYQANTSETFGSNYTIDSAGNKYQDESTPLHPRSPYGVAKLAAHKLVANYRESYGVFASSCTLFNHESPMRGDKFVTKKITKWIGRFVKDPTISPLELGNLNAYRDWGHARDYVRAMWLILQQDTPEDYVIATGEAYTVADFLTYAFKEIGIDDWSPYVKINPKFYRPAEVDYLRGDATKARTKLGWSPTISFPALVSEMVQYDIKNV